jgi:CDP-glycerol glycerophosphotransferase (TagB/SpsB family)
VSLSLLLAGDREPARLRELEATIDAQDHAGVEVIVEADRNRAVGAAAGDHVWFVEPQDLLLPGALAHIAERLAAAAPDVLLLGHNSIDARGKVRPGLQKRLLALDEPVTLAREPALAGAATRAWDKVFRRELLRDLGLRFGDGRFAGMTVAWPALAAAERIAAAPELTFVHRPPADRPGSPFDVFAAYDAVLERVEAKEIVVPAMVRHQLSLLGSVPEADRGDFFRRVAEYRRRHRTGDEPAPAGRVARLREATLDHGSYPAYRLLEGARRRRAAPARTRRRVVARARARRIDRYYRSRLEQPIDDQLAVFGAYWFRGYSCNPRAIYEKARELVPGMRGVWVVYPRSVGAIPPGVEYVVAGTREYFDVIARARYFVNNVNFPDHLVKREGTLHVMTHHGTPLKTMGLDLRGTPVAGRRMNFEALIRRCERWDFSVSQNAFTTPIWERVYPTSYESLEVGYPRNDVLANATVEDVRRARAELGIAPGQTAILYAPTHREYHAQYTPVLDLARFAEALGPDHVVLARAHYFYDPGRLLRELHEAGRVRDVAAHPSVEELCLAADMLVTDYSSLMFDYGVLDRPIVIHAADWEVYNAMRGTYFDLPSEPPGVVVRTEGDLAEAITSGAAAGDEAAQARAEFRARFCSLDDGRASERVVRRLWFGEREAAAAPQVSRAR